MKFSLHHFSTLIRCSRLSRIKKSSQTTVVPQRERNLDQLNISPTLSSHHPAMDMRSGNMKNTFQHLKLRSDVIESLASINISEPTVIQTLAIPEILKGKNVLCAAETGSGKTLAYLAPLISQLKDEEENHGLHTRLRHPRALILLHSRELANQVLSVAKSLCHVARCKVVGLIGGPKRRFIKDYLSRPIDIVIATPTSLFKLQKEDRIQFSDLRHVVIDEADTLLDESFQETVLSILQSVKIRQSKPTPSLSLAQDAQFTIAGATIPNAVLKKLEKIVPNIRKITSKSLHQILPHVEQKFLMVSAESKAARLASLLRESPIEPTIVFCNTVPSCDWTARYLESNGVTLIKLHAGLDPWARQSKLEKFINNKANILVTTDVASRGIDLPNVTRVVLFDWPHGLTDYIHRVGRTGRIGMKEKCIALSFLTRKRDVKMAWTIKDAADLREALLNKKFVQKIKTRR